MRVTPKNLSKVIEASSLKYEHLRRARSKFLTQMAGRFYSRIKGADREEHKASPINLLHNAVNTTVPNLVFNDPRVKVRSATLAYRDYGDMLELATNHVIKQMNLRKALRLAVMDSIFHAGFIKTGIADSGRVVQFEGMDVVVGQPFAERVDPDDMILDPAARDWDEQLVIGNRFRASREELLESGLYDADLVQKLTSRYDDSSDYRTEAAQISGDDPNGVYKDVYDFVDLAELYLPREGVIVTVPAQKGVVFDKFLREAEASGPDTGPYHMLGYTFLGDNLLPVPPASIWYDLHILANRIARKISRQAERSKRVLAYEGPASEDVAEIAEADDGETVQVNNSQAIREINFGGTTDESYAYMEWVKRQFSEQTGNIDLLSGTGTNAPTATQSEMLQANTSVRLSDLQNQVYQFTAEVARDVAFYLHTDPLIDLPLTRRVRGVEVEVRYTPEMRHGDFFDMSFETQPYSMARQDPNQKVRRLLEAATAAIPAAAQAAQLLGPGFKVDKYLSRLFKEIGIEDADEFMDGEAFVQWFMLKLQAELNSGKAQPSTGGGAPPMLADPAAMGFRPQQPVPSQMGPTGGISPETEQASAQQEVAAELQRGGNEPSARAMALARG